jgi:hypothetical protein
MSNDTGSNDDDGSKATTEESKSSTSTSSSSSFSLFNNPIINNINEYRYSKRIDRLKGCKVLEETLQDCKNVANGIQANRLLRLEDTKDGIRITRLMKWQESRTSLLDGTTKIQSEIMDGQYNSNLCQREEHAIWLCRGLCLQCGPDILKLRNCIDDKKSKILNHPNTYYNNNTKRKQQNNNENNQTIDETSTTFVDNNYNNQQSSIASSDSSPLCVKYQERIGDCVAEGIKFLNQYQKEKKEKEANEKN